MKRNHPNRRALRLPTDGNLALAPAGAQRPHLHLATDPTYVTKDSAGNIVSQAGTPLSSQPYSYTGRPFDTIDGFYNLRAREYDANTGRWTQVDPVSNLSQYAYAVDNPLLYTDPFGLQPGTAEQIYEAVEQSIESAPSAGSGGGVAGGGATIGEIWPVLPLIVIGSELYGLGKSEIDIMNAESTQTELMAENPLAKPSTGGAGSRGGRRCPPRNVHGGNAT